MITAPAYMHHWTHRFSETVQDGRRQQILRDPNTGECIASLHVSGNYGGYWVNHGPFATADAAIPCTESRCECWRKMARRGA